MIWEIKFDPNCNRTNYVKINMFGLQITTNALTSQDSAKNLEPVKGNGRVPDVIVWQVHMVIDAVKFYWWLVKVTLVVDLRFCPKILGQWWGPTKAFRCCMNADRVGIVLAGSGYS